MTDTPVALIVFLALGTVAVVLALLLVRSRQELSRSQLHSEATETELESASRYAADLAARLQAVESELRHLVNARIPDLASSLAHSNVPVPGPLGTATLSPELDRSIDAVLSQVREEVTKERKRVDAAAQATMRGASTTIQALLYQLQTLLQRMQEKYEDPLVAEDLLAADFLNEQALRRIQSTAVVCGAWPGLTRDNSHLADVVVGASSRLSGYERIQVSNLLRDPVGVIARAVEPVAVTLTELMANALHYSHPELPVVVTLQQGNRGVSVIIDDAGVGMTAEELTRAKRLMSGEEAILITELGDPPRNGFAAIGQLVRQYGFAAHVEPSPYGGVRAVVHIPGEPLLTLLDEAEHPMSAMAPTPPYGTPVLPGYAPADFRSPVPSQGVGAGAPLGAGAGASPGAGTGTSSGTADSGAGELPRRRRRRRADAAEKAAAAGGTGDASTGSGGAKSVDPPGTSRPAEPGGEPDTAPGTSRGTDPRSGSGSKSTPGSAFAPPTTPEQSAERWSAFQRGTASGRAAAMDRPDGPEERDSADSPRSPHSPSRSTDTTRTSSTSDTAGADGVSGDAGPGASEGNKHA
ncbi:ATP-binding protein [Streptomyces marispadix]|uniref:histidine kinase n=1 Tax=Streptomyces marispadix TaxID=2922868 RepID=A0ABS9SXA7_9ACTN|nr:sensor histidine kinase [Streptomyces marispadix]MCH6160907.1 sensor histidine kinase [Streptomyces marispadix]